MKVILQNYLFPLVCLSFIYCLYSLIVFLRMPKNFTNAYSRIYRKYVKFFLTTVILYILSWLLWSKGEKISNYFIPVITNLREPLASIILIAITSLPLILGIIASVYLALYILEGGPLTWLLPLVIFKKHNRDVAIASIEKKWRIFIESRSRQQKFLVISMIVFILCLSIPLVLIIVILFLLTFSK